MGENPAAADQSEDQDSLHVVVDDNDLVGRQELLSTPGGLDACTSLCQLN